MSGKSQKKYRRAVAQMVGVVYAKTVLYNHTRKATYMYNRMVGNGTVTDGSEDKQ